MTRPPRTEAHTLRAVLLQQFHDAGLVPVISTNGGIPDADIQVVKGAQPGDVPECWLTEKGSMRLQVAQQALIAAVRLTRVDVLYGTGTFTPSYIGKKPDA